MQCWYLRFEHIKNFKEFLRHLFSSKMGGGGLHTCMYIHKSTYWAFSLEPLDGFWWKLGRYDVLMVPHKYCCFSTRSAKGRFQGGAKIGRGTLLWETSSDQMATATNRMHRNDLKACGKKCCYFWFHSEVKFLTHLWRLFWTAILAYFHAISMEYYAVKC